MKSGNQPLKEQYLIFYSPNLRSTLAKINNNCLQTGDKRQRALRVVAQSSYSSQDFSFYQHSSQEAIRKARVGPLCLILNWEKTRGCYYINEEQVHLINSLQKFRFHIGPFGFESSRVVNSRSSSFSSSVNVVDFKQNHINHFVFCVFWFHSFTFLSLLLLFVVFFTTKWY